MVGLPLEPQTLPALQEAQVGHQQSFHGAEELQPHHEQPKEALGTQCTNTLPRAETSNFIKEVLTVTCLGFWSKALYSQQWKAHGIYYHQKL